MHYQCILHYEKLILTLQDGGSPPNQLVDRRTVNVMVVLEPPVFGQPVYAVTQPEDDYSAEVTNTLFRFVASYPALPMFRFLVGIIDDT